MVRILRGGSYLKREAPALRGCRSRRVSAKKKIRWIESSPSVSQVADAVSRRPRLRGNSCTCLNLNRVSQTHLWHEPEFPQRQQLKGFTTWVGVCLKQTATFNSCTMCSGKILYTFLFLLILLFNGTGASIGYQASFCLFISLSLRGF